MRAVDLLIADPARGFCGQGHLDAREAEGGWAGLARVAEPGEAEARTVLRGGDRGLVAGALYQPEPSAS